MPFFSIIIPTYNSSAKLKNALESVLCQTFQDFEVLIMDDGSTDDTETVVAGFNDSRIIYEWDTNSGGPARPRNRGIKKALAEWICFLDADDSWTSEKLKICFNLINDSVDFMYHDLQITGQPSSFLRSKVLKGKKLTNPIFKDLLINGNVISNSSVVVRKSILIKIDGIDESINMVASEDYNAWIRISFITNKFFYIPHILGYYTFHSSGISKKDMSLSMYAASKDFLHKLKGNELKQYKALLSYVQGSHLYTLNLLNPAIPKFYKSIKGGIGCIKVKSLFMLASIYLNSKTYR